MATFTALSAWTSAQDRTAANEIVLAYSERRQCVLDGAIAELASGDNAQDTVFWTAMQEWVASSITAEEWIDDNATITDGDAALPVHTIATFKTNSTLTGGTTGVIGFRRATTWPSDWTDYADAAYSYGPIESGDIVGPWIYEDLQKAFDAMRWSHKQGAVYGVAQKKGVRAGFYATAEEAVSAALSAWPTAWDDGAVLSYISSFRVQVSADGWWSCIVVRNRENDIFQSIPVHLAHSASAYRQITDDGATFNTVDFATPGWYESGTFASATVATRTAVELPFSDFPAPVGYSENIYYGAFSDSDSSIILKWTFTNTL